MKTLAILMALVLVIFASGCVAAPEPVCGNGVCENGETEISCPTDCASPTDWYYGICSDQDLQDYILDYVGSDQQLVNQFEDYCFSMTVDWEGCEIYEPNCIFSIYNTAMAECISVCEFDSQGRPAWGHVLFSAWWYLGTPRTFPPFLPSAGVFKMQPQCGIVASVARFFGLETRVFS